MTLQEQLEDQLEDVKLDLDNIEFRMRKFDEDVEAEMDDDSGISLMDVGEEDYE